MKMQTKIRSMLDNPEFWAKVEKPIHLSDGEIAAKTAISPCHMRTTCAVFSCGFGIIIGC